MGDGGSEFAADELAALRGFFRDEAHEALELVAARALAAAGGALAPDALAEMLRVTHTLKGSAGTVGLAEVADLVHRFEGALAALRGAPAAWSATTAERIAELADALRAHVDTGGAEAATAAAARVRALLTGLAPPPGAAAPPPGGGAAAPPSAAPSDDEPGDAATTRLGASPDPGAPASVERSVLRVDAERVDALMAATGELLFDRTRIERRVQQLRSLARDLGRTRQRLRDELHGLRDAAAADARAALARRLDLVEAQLAEQATQVAQATAAMLEDSEALRGTIAALQDGLTRVRMQTARGLFAQLSRALRELARAAGTRVELRTGGEETEFDKSVAEQVTDPMIQLLRNAVAHGLEPAEERLRRGKPAVGTITLTARQESSLVVIEVGDDGRGIDTAALRERFVASGRWSPSRAKLASDADVLAAMFDPGASSRDDADELAGRGIGLDVVREAVARLGGELTVTSLPGRGTTFTLRVPVSTAVSMAMLFKVGGQVYAVPHVHVEGSVVVAGDAETAEVRGATVPVVSLPRLLATPSTPPAAIDQRTALVLGYAGRSLAVAVDRVIGPRELVVRPLGPLLSPLPLYAGATVSASGKVQLILDVAHLARLAHPAAAVDEPAARPLALRQVAGRALVADDSRAIREALTTMLAREGWIVDVAEDGARAWRMLQQLAYDLVVTDLEMPQLGGFELVERLRRDPRHAATPVVVITSRVGPETRRRARQLGVGAMVPKPITRRKLLDALQAR